MTGRQAFTGGGGSSSMAITVAAPSPARSKATMTSSPLPLPPMLLGTAAIAAVAAQQAARLRVAGVAISATHHPCPGYPPCPSSSSEGDSSSSGCRIGRHRRSACSPVARGTRARCRCSRRTRRSRRHGGSALPVAAADHGATVRPCMCGRRWLGQGSVRLAVFAAVVALRFLAKAPARMAASLAPAELAVAATATSPTPSTQPPPAVAAATAAATAPTATAAAAAASDGGVIREGRATIWLPGGNEVRRERCAWRRCRRPGRWPVERARLVRTGPP